MVHYVKGNLKVVDARGEESHSLPLILPNKSLIACIDFSIAIVEPPFSHPKKFSLCYPYSLTPFVLFKLHSCAPTKLHSNPLFLCHCEPLKLPLREKVACVIFKVNLIPK